MAESKQAEAEPKKEDLDSPKADFIQLVKTYWLQAMIACGKVMNPLTRKYDKDLAMARYHISVLEILEDKTRGNLSEEESKHGRDLLDQARMAYIDAVSTGGGAKVAEAPNEERIS